MDINANKERFIELVSTIERPQREGKNIIDFLEDSDFFIAPASTKFHMAVEGGLCQHSLNVYDNMLKLKEMYLPEIPEDTVRLTALFHDISKTNFYNKTCNNTKVYSSNGSKYDDLGRFDWVSTPGFSIIKPQDRDFICGEHGVNSYYILSEYYDLSTGEASAIINHHCGLDNNQAFRDMNEALNRFPTLLLLHLSDMLSTYINESPYLVFDEEE